MNTILIFIWIYSAFIAMSFWESSVEGRNAWDKGKHGWKIKLTKSFTFTSYHFFLAGIMLPLLFTLPLIIYGWNTKLFGILVSAFFSGMVVEDFFWYIVNPKVQFKELFSSFSDYYPWLKINGRKIIPLGYLAGILIAVLSWIFIWS